MLNSNQFMTRVRVLQHAGNKTKALLEVVLDPDKAQSINFHVVTSALRMLFPHTSSVQIDVYGV